MRLHRNLTFAVIDSIRDIFNEGVYADKAVEKMSNSSLFMACMWPQQSPFLWPGGGPNPDHQFLIFRLAADLLPPPQ